MRALKKRDKIQAMQIRRKTIIDLWFDNFMQLGLNRFKWVGLPSTCDERFLEKTLLEHGRAIFFKDDIADVFLNLPVNYNNKLDVYDNPVGRQGFSNGYQSRFLNPKNSVLIFDNYSRQPLMPKLMYYAELLADIDMTIQQNLYNMRTPNIWATPDKQRLTFENLELAYESFIPVIKVVDQFNLDNLKVYPNQTPDNLQSLYDLKKKVYSEVLEILGITTVTFEKSERLLRNEVEFSLGATNMYQNVGLNARKQACELINNIFSELNVDVYFNQTKISDTLNNEVSK